jgi:serine/threonine protein kinase/WD40 repeat protein
MQPTDSNDGREDDQDRSDDLGERVAAELERYEAATPDQRIEILRSLPADDNAMRMLIRMFGEASIDEPQTPPSIVTVDLDPSKRDAMGSTISPAAPAIPEQVGKYQILKLLGAGGMGSVYLATDAYARDSQPVALKTIRSEHLQSAVSTDRFIGEMRAMAAVQHEGILPILDTGAEAGVPFFTMPFVDGEDFSKRIRTGDDAVPGLDELMQRARVVQQVALAVAHLHNAGFLHRDIKPANILLQNAGHGVWLSDFGIVKMLGGQSDLSATGHFVGTLNYAPPEKLFESDRVDLRSDVYSLGTTLYAALTGVKPFGEGSTTEVALRVKHGQLASVREINPAIPVGIATVCHRATEKNPDDRYETAGEFAADLNRAINGLKTYLQPITRAGRFARIAIRHPLKSSLIGATLCALAVATFLYGTRPAYLSLEVEPADASVMLDDQALPHTSGHVQWLGDPGPHRIDVNAPGHEPQTFEVRMQRGRESITARSVRLVALRGRLEIDSFPTGATVTVFDPGGKFVCEGTTPWRSPDLDSGPARIEISKPLFRAVQVEADIPKGGKLTVLENARLESAFSKQIGSPMIGQRLEELYQPFTEPIRADDISFVDLAKRIADRSGTGLLLNTKELQKLDLTRDSTITVNIRSLADLSTYLRGKGLALTLVGGSDSGQWMLTTVEASERTLYIGLYSLEELGLLMLPQQIMQLIQINVTPHIWEHLGGPCTLSPVPGHQAIAVAADMQTQAYVFTYLQSLSELAKRDRMTDVTHRDLWADGVPIGVLKTIDEDFPFRLDRQSIDLNGHTNRISAIAFLDESRALSASFDGTVRIWSLSDGELIRSIKVTDRRVNCVLPLPDMPDHFVTGDGDGWTTLWNASQDDLVCREHRHMGDVTCLVLSPRGEYLLSGAFDGYLVRYALPELKMEWFGQMHDITTSMVLSTDERLIVGRPEHEQIIAYSKHKYVYKTFVPSRDPTSLLTIVPSVAHSGRSILISAGTQLNSWDAGRFTTIGVGETLPSNIHSIATFSGDGLLATAHANGRVIFRDVDTLKPAAILRLPPNAGPYRIAASPDGQHFAVGYQQLGREPSFAAITIYSLLRP